MGKGLVGTTDWGIAAVAGGVAVAGGAVGLGEATDAATCSGSGVGGVRGSERPSSHATPASNNNDTIRMHLSKVRTFIDISKTIYQGRNDLRHVAEQKCTT